MKSPWLISGLTLAADQLTKLLVVTRFSPGESLGLLPPILQLTYVQNTGAAFGLFKGRQGLFIGVSLLVIGWMTRELLAKPSLALPTKWGYALVLGGSVGNLIDRMRFGYVIDFIDLGVWPVFNVGDSAITIGVALLIWQAVRRR
ncbi:MAG: signal peptidase II [Candidatus Omnitrophica bacterium]|nr:signal peptidase II [Candidatus Omnitrophota bacterium]MBI3021268.1 signal peptidase II [Candidatus Omnitrophota bacterium]MBI3083079.1 signal peptidase II [Candidatus Omnitrophota bacterium]